MPRPSWFRGRLSSLVPRLSSLVTVRRNREGLARALTGRATGDTDKGEAADKVIEAIRSVLQGKIDLSPRMTDRLLHSMAGDQEPGHSSIGGLSDCEVEVFSLLGEGLTTRQIAETLNPSVETIGTHPENIETKPSLEKNHELIRRAVEWTLRRAGRRSPEHPPQ